MKPKHSPAEVITTVRQLDVLLREFETTPDQLLRSAQDKAGEIRRAAALRQLRDVPTARLRETAKGLRLDAIERAGFTSVADLAQADPSRLTGISGVGDETARKVVAAARQVLSVTEGSTVIRFNVDERPAAQTELLALVRSYDTSRRIVDDWGPYARQLRSAVGSMPDIAEPATRTWARRLFIGGSAKAAAHVSGSMRGPSSAAATRLESLA